MSKYAVELVAYDITYVPESAVKSRVLADFLTETPVGTEVRGSKKESKEICNISDHEEWRLYTDGASNKKFSKAGLILIGPS